MKTIGSLYRDPVDPETGIRYDPDSGLTDAYGRYPDSGIISWMHTGKPDEQLWVLSCRHGTTRSPESKGGSEGEILSRLIDEHKKGVNSSMQSFQGHWICFCIPHRGTT